MGDIPSSTRLTPTVLTVTGGLIALAFAYQLVFGLFDGDPTGLMRVGQADGNLVTDQLGRPPVVVEGDGHDGFYFFQLALDPLLSDLSVLSSFDDPAHRASRLVYPLISGAGGLLPPRWIPWALIAVNILAFGFGTSQTGQLAGRLGASGVLGLFFTVNIGLLFALSIDGSSVLACALLMAGLLALHQGRDRQAVGWFALTILTREFYLLFAIGALAHHHRRDLRRLVVRAVSAALPYLVVRGFFTWRFGDVVVSEAATERNFGPPFQGISESLSVWLQGTTIEILAVTIVTVSAIGILILAIRRPSALSISGALSLPALMLFTSDVLAEAYDASRVLAPLAILFPLAMLTSSERHSTSTRGASDA